MMKLQLLSVVVLAYCALSEGNLFTIRKDKIWDCDYKGYVPGGKVKDVGKIDFPVAKMSKSGIASVLGPTSQASTLAMHSLNTIKAITGAFKNIAPTLGPMLGVFGAVTGVFKSLTEPKPQDILNACNAAMGTLTKDMNDKIERMEGYVDSQIITVEKNLIQREYKASFRMWTECVHEVTRDLSNECQREAYATLSANRPKFAVFASKVMSTGLLSGFEARELEAYLVPFRDYANLVLMMLKPLVEMYAKDKTTIGKRHYERYSKDLKNQAEFFEKYASAAYKAILKVHNGEGGYGVCRKTLDCGPIKVIKEGFFNTHTANSARCNTVIEDGTKQMCQIAMTIRKDHQVPANYYVFKYPRCHSDAEGAKEYAGRLLLPECKKYQTKNAQIMQAYWKGELLDFIPVWKMVKDIVKPSARGDAPVVAAEDAVADEEEHKFQFSERFAARWNRALEN
jgi:hypothetical protein